jgi:hypothetical protein
MYLYEILENPSEGMEDKTLNKAFSLSLICTTIGVSYSWNNFQRAQSIGGRKYRRDPRGLGEMNKVC